MPLDPRIHALFDGPNFAHVATSMPDGSPHVAPVWIGIEDGRPTFAKEETAVAVRNLRRDPRVAISVNNVEDPYEEAHVRGRAVELRGEPEASAWLDALSIPYTGAPYPTDHPVPLVLIVVEIERAGFGHFTDVEHTPPDFPLQLPRRPTG